MEQDIRDFEALPFKQKVFFSTHNLPDVKSNIYMECFAGKDAVGDAYRHANQYYKKLLEWYSTENVRNENPNN